MSATHDWRLGPYTVDDLDDPVRSVNRPPALRAFVQTRSETDDDRLAFQVVVEHLVAHLAAPARFLVAAERQRRVVDVVGVDPDRARAHQRGGLMGLRDVP